MQKKITVRLLPAAAINETTVKAQLAATAGIPISAITGYHSLKRSIDARGKTVFINLTATVFINEPFYPREPRQFDFRDVSRATHRTVIIGAGPAGLFAAVQLIKKGIRPILLERGKEVRARRRDLAILNKQGIVDPESNYCFGEGGAGTYSDGKLYTRSNKRGDIERILNLFVHFGAEESILFDAHPHIGTNKLPQIISAMRERIVACGGQFLFGKKVTGFSIEKEVLKSVTTSDGDIFEANDFILATGHSARDIFQLLWQHKIAIEAKPFALGVRIEHPQYLIDTIQYHQGKDIHLPPASYSLVQQVDARGVFSFCMCPGGIIAPAVTAPAELVVNGWSPSKRNNPYANSGMVVQVEQKDAFEGLKANKAAFPGILTEDHPLLLMHFQKMVEEKAYTAGGGNFVAPAQRMADMCNRKFSTTLPACSYLPGVQPANLQEVLPDFTHRSLSKAFLAFGKKLKGYFTNDALVVATESRTSSPVRIPRDPITLTHPGVKNLYPCGEGAGYAGGIISAAMDGENVAKSIAAKLA